MLSWRSTFERQLEEIKLKDIDTQIAKMLQFHEACNQRMGVGVVGPSGCGKSTIWKVLENAYKRQHKKYVVHIMNPKSMARVRLFCGTWTTTPGSGSMVC